VAFLLAALPALAAFTNVVTSVLPRIGVESAPESSALRAGPITASRITLVTVNPLLSIVLGVTLFGDVLRGGGLWISLEVLALAVLVVGVVVLTRSPLVAGADDGADGEMLGGARERAMMALPIEAMP